MDLEPDSERMVVEHYRSSPGEYLIYLFHEATYRHALPAARDADVLDLGCGSGYGSAMLAEVAKSVVGVDVSGAAVAYAREHYGRANARFETIAPHGALPFRDGQFDLVTCFQVIEHVADPAAFVRELARVLKRGGTAIVATPDRATRLLPGQRPWNRWHLVEYSGVTLERLLRTAFGAVEMRYMSGRDDVIELELARCRTVRWAALPFTFPGAPETWRQAGLALLHRLRPRAAPAAATGAALRDFGFGVDDLAISESPARSVNLVATARRG